MNTERKQGIFKLIITVVVLSLATALFLPFYSEILLAAVFALAMEPTLGRLLQAKHLRWKYSVAGIICVMFFLTAAPITMVGYKTYNYFQRITATGFQESELFKKLVVFREQFLRVANQTMETLHLNGQMDLAGLTEEALTRGGRFVVGVATAFAANIPQVLLSIFVFCIALYFFLAESSTIKNSFLRMGFLSSAEAHKLISVLQKSSFNSIVTSIALGAFQATFVSLGALALDGGDFWVIFVITFFCSFVPVIGAGPVALALGVIKVVMGNYGQALGFLIVAAVAGTADNVLRPYLFSSQDDDLHPVASLLALIGALVIFGMPGVFLGPVIASVAIKIVPIFYPSPAKAK